MPKLKFTGAQVGAPHMREYHSMTIDFNEIGEVQDLDEAVVQHLLEKFPNMFELVSERELVDRGAEADLVDRKRGRPPTLRKEIEQRFGKSIEEVLAERASKSVREIAKELGVSKSCIAKWRKRYLTE